MIALERSPDPEGSDIWVLDWQSGAGARLTHQGYNGAPSFSPNGRWIAFRSDNSRYGHLNIWAIRTDGSGLHRLTKGKSELGADTPAFSADGRWVAFRADGRGGRREIQRVRLSGGRRQVLVRKEGGISAFSPSYSPNGRHLAWVESRESGRGAPWIYIGSPNGRHPRRLVTGSEPDFAPDGRSIVFGRQGRCISGAAGSEIKIVSLKTRQVQRVASSCSEELSSPSYSPDGQWIAYTRYSQTGSRLAFIPITEAPFQAPIAGLGSDFPVDADPDWQPIP